MTVACAVAACIAAYADDMTPAKRADIRTLMELTRGGEYATALANAGAVMVARQYQLAGRQISQQALQTVRDDLLLMLKDKVDQPGGLREQIEDIYGKHYTHAEIKQLVGFFKGELGQKWANTLPVMMREGNEANQTWTMAIKPIFDQRIAERLKKEGLEWPLPSAPPPAPVPAPVAAPKK